MEKYKITKAGSNKKFNFDLFVVFNGFDIVATFKIFHLGDSFFGLRLMCESFGECEIVKDNITEFLRNKNKKK